ncbi:hypothetical protein C8Q74DRAFT_1237767 [Fomes fomentarius]|nr:hypothetical protein C8Q74DRAFT_1237767 [Fomes fomentarius]
MSVSYIVHHRLIPARQSLLAHEWTVVAGDNTTCLPEGTLASLTNARPPPSPTSSNFNAISSPSSSTHTTAGIAALGSALGGGAIIAVGIMLYRQRSKGRGQTAGPVPPPETEEARDTSDQPSPSVAGRIRSVTTRGRALYTLSEHPSEENTLAAHAHETQTEVTSPGISGPHPANTQTAAIPNEGRSDPPARVHDIGTPRHSRRPGSDEDAQATLSVTHGIIEESR